MSIHLKQGLSILGCINSGNRFNTPIVITEQPSYECFTAMDDDSLRHRIWCILASLGVIVEDVDSIAEAIANHLSQVKTIDLPCVLKLLNAKNLLKSQFSLSRTGFLLQALQNFYLQASEREFDKFSLEVALNQESIIQLCEALESWEESLKSPDWSAVRSIWPNRPWLPIEDIYSELHILSDDSLSTRFQTLDGIEELQVSHSAFAAFSSRALSIESVLTTLKHRVVLVGEPGSGKTTLVKWIAQSILSRMIDIYNFPIVILLGQFARALRSNHSTSLLEFFLTYYCGVTTQKAVDLAAAVQMIARRCFKGQLPCRILLLLDGWDEVPSNERSTVLDAIERDSRFFPTLITTRPSGIPISLRGERTLYIGRLQPSSMHALIQRHCARIKQSNLYSKIVNYLYKAPSSIEVAGNPYILTLLCEVAASCEYTQTPLPRNAAGTLHKAIELLQSDPKEHGDIMRLEESVLNQMKELAFQLSFGSEHKRYEFSVKDIAFAKTTEELDSSAIVRSRLVNKFANNVDIYFFIHARFQEFFAAWRLDQIDGDDVEIIAKRYALSQRWLEEFKFASGLLSGEHLNHFWAAVREQAQEDDLFGVVPRTVAHLLAATGVKDGGQSYLGWDIRDQLEFLLQNDLHLDETAAAWVALDADSLLECVKRSRKTFSERAMEAIYRALPVYIRRAANFDEWLVQSGSLSSWLIGIVAPGMVLNSDIAQLRNIVQDVLRQVDERSYALRQLGSMRDPGIVEFAISVLDDQSHPLFDDCITALGRIGGRQAAVALASCLISLHEKPLDDTTWPIYFQLGDALRIDGYGAIEPRSRDILAAHLAGLSPDDPRVALILQALMGVISGQIEWVVLSILETSRESENRVEAAKALQGCSDRAIVERAFRIAHDDQDNKLRIMLLRILQNCEPPDGGAWLLQCLMEKTKPRQERLAALAILVNSLRQGFDLPVRSAVQTFVREHMHHMLSQTTDEFTATAIDVVDILPENPVPILIQLLQQQEISLDLKLSICDKLGELRAIEATDILTEMLSDFMEESQENPQGYRMILKSLAHAISEIAPERLLTFLEDSSTYDMPVVEVLADLAKRKGYRIYRNCIFDSDGKLIGYTPGNDPRAITEEQNLIPTTINGTSVSKVDKLKIFLASPSDVNTERHYVEKVVEELNRTVASTQEVVLEVISSKNTFPGYGKDGQAIINEQIGKMHEYELFIGIMWNRIGTQTPRAKSGTLEEFAQAVKALIRKGKPTVWFYFRQSPANFTTQEELNQRAEVLDFRSKFRSNGLFREYKSPVEFRDQLRENLILWLNQRKGEVLKSRFAGTKQSKVTPKIKTESESSVPEARKKVSSSATTKETTAKTITTTKPLTTSRKPSTSKSSAARSTRALKSPEDWVMLDGNFFQVKSSNTQPDRSIILQILPKDMEQAAELKALHPGEFHNQKQITYADLHEAGIMQVSSVATESSAGKNSFSITLNPSQRSQNSGLGMEVNYQNYNADEVAELRARLILLGEPLPEELRHLVTTKITGLYNQATTIEHGIFPDLWDKLKTQQRLFLPRAWLWAVYCLKMCQIVEDVLELELGPIKNKVMPVRFRGRRKQFYSNQAPSIIKVIENCTLNT